MAQEDGSSDYESRPEVGRKRNDDSDVESNENPAAGGDMTYAGPRRIPSPTGSEYDPPLEAIQTVSASAIPGPTSVIAASETASSTPTSFMRKPLGFGASLSSYADQTPSKGKFRVQGYVNDPSLGSTTPHALRGSGPYNSLFRAGAPDEPTQEKPQTSIMLPGVPNMEPMQRAPSRIQATYAQTPAPLPDYSNDNFGALPPLPLSPGLSHVLDDPSAMQNNHTYLQPRTGATEHVATPLAFSHPTPPARISSPASSSRSVARGAKPRLLTLLIEDRRSGVDELAEIMVPLTKADGSDGGWWADARDISQKLQSGPSRIDGPAKVYTMRGKYRQTFLRVSETNEETTQSANLKVEKDKTLTIFVDGLHMPTRLQPSTSSPGSTYVPETTSLPSPISTAAPHPPSPFSAASPAASSSPGPASKRKRMPSTSANTYAQLQPTPYTPTESASPMPQPSPQKKPKRAAKPPRDIPSFDRIPERELAPSRVDSRHEHSLGNSHAHGRAPALPPAPSNPSHSLSLVPTPARRENPKKVLRCIAAYLRSTISQDADRWRAFVDFLQARATSPAQLVAQYWFVQQQMEKYVHTWSPMDLKYGAHTQIELEHVAVALDIKSEWYEECRETLALLLRYGQNGSVYQDERVVAAAADTVPRVLPDRRPTELLELLRAVHQEWTANTEGHRAPG